MRRILLGVSAFVLGLVLVGSAEAGPKGGSSHGSSHNSYHMTHGSKMKDGKYFYKGKDHKHWTYRYWWGKYGCYTYYCPSTSCWYYWYPQDSCYYPVSYIATATPVREVAPVGVATGVQQIVNVTNNSPGAASAVGGGAPVGPAGPGGPAGPAAPMPPSP
jgi:hypothetical protein